MNKRTVCLTEEQYHKIIDTLLNGFTGSRPNDRIATALVLEANLGIRISDILTLRLTQIVKDGTRYRLDIVEKKTGKRRDFTVPKEVYWFLRDYCADKGIAADAVIFDLTERAVQKQLAKACDYLGYEGISTHSFRKYFGTGLYYDTNCDIALVQQALQHSSAAVTRRYIGIQTKVLEDALSKRVDLPKR